MAKDNTTARASLHGYQPLNVDENALSDADRREAIVQAVAHPRDWSRHITPDEWQEFERELADIEKQAEIRRRDGVHGSEAHLMANKRKELAQRGTMRAFAREKFGHIWLGDGPPPWSR